ncbi:MAG: hypothetical protein DMF61_20610 [Blastocatellia bacterium AA13]|nr:MAG: hypothetical protein DMF61_20610 [Blastocatellia bacterium AA13]
MKSIATALLLLSTALAQPLQSSVPVSREAHHHMKFENKYVRVFDVVVAPGDATLFHTHSNDYIFVSIGDADLKAEAMGAQPGDMKLKDGEVRFTKATITHRVSNIASTPFRNITIEVLSTPGTAPKQFENIPLHTLILENDKLRAERLILEPGQSVPEHRYTQPGLAVAVSAGKVVFETKGQKPQTVEFKPGDFRWRDGAVTHSVKNVGNTRFEVVDIEWK